MKLRVLLCETLCNSVVNGLRNSFDEVVNFDVHYNLIGEGLCG